MILKALLVKLLLATSRSNPLSLKPMKFPIYLLLPLTILGAGLSAQTDPQTKLSATVNEVIEVLYDTGLAKADRSSRLQTAIEDDFSFAVIARRALGRNWNLLDAGQQTRFVDLFTDLLIQTYSSGFAADSRPTIQWVSQKELKKNYLEIKSLVTLAGNTFPIDYRLVQLQEGWQVYDVLVENVSLVGNYRKQFSSILQKGDAEDLLDQLEKKVAES